VPLPLAFLYYFRERESHAVAVTSVAIVHFCTFALLLTLMFLEVHVVTYGYNKEYAKGVEI
jgi:hypothetical protein